MKKGIQCFGLALAFAGAVSLVPATAWAGGPYSARGSVRGPVSQRSSIRSMPSTRPSIGKTGTYSGTRSLRSSPGISPQSQSRGTRPPTRSASGNSGYGRSSRDSSSSNRSGDALRSLGNALGQELRNRNSRESSSNYPYDPYDGRYGDGMAKAYRDVGIANAVVGLVGVIVQGAQNNAACQAQGHWARERVLVAPARYETRQVWIPAAFDPYTGRQLGGGYYETRTEYVPAMYEERQVLLTGPQTRYGY